MSRRPRPANVAPRQSSSNNRRCPVALVAGRYVMVLAAAFEEWREKRRREQIARAVTETLRENNAEWDAWNERRMQAEQHGEAFDEPPPSARQRGAA